MPSIQDMKYPRITHNLSMEDLNMVYLPQQEVK